LDAFGKVDYHFGKTFPAIISKSEIRISRVRKSTGYRCRSSPGIVAELVLYPLTVFLGQGLVGNNLTDVTGNKWQVALFTGNNAA
jgi:hypothetical protein